jgi:hypothetical protein
MNRKTLFRKSKPVLRQFVTHEGQELSSDMGILWAAHKRESFPMPEMDERAFTDFVLQWLSGFGLVLMMEDENAGFRKGVGPVCLICVSSNGWMICPQVFWFSWATPRNKLRCSVAFVQKTKHDKTVGACEFRTEHLGVKLAQHICKFVPTWRYVGKIWFGTPSGDQFIFSIKGAKHAGTNGRGQNADGVHRDGERAGTAGGSEERESVVPEPDVQGVEERDGHG